MNEYNPPKVSIAILDYNRPKESKLLLDSLVNANFRHEVVFLANGGDTKFAQDEFNAGRIDRLLINKQNNGCGLGTRQLFQSCMTEYVIYVQSDQFLFRPFTENELNKFIEWMENPRNRKFLYVDLAGNQGNGKFSERALLINRKKYLDIPDMDKTIGGPGPWANYQWTENLVQKYMSSYGLNIITSNETFYFANNGKWSQRSYPCGGETVHATDTKLLKIIKPLKQRYDDFPNLKLNNVEWEEVLSGNWPVEGKIPEADKVHSFVYWKE